MRLDVLIPTLDRAELLGGTLQSLFEAPVPEGLAATITVIENRCTDGTVELVRDFMARHPGPSRPVLQQPVVHVFVFTYRRWCFWRGVSRGLMDRTHRLRVPYLAGIPRFIHGRAARGLARLVAGRVRGEPWERSFRHELPLWDLAGYA